MFYNKYGKTDGIDYAELSMFCVQEEVKFIADIQKMDSPFHVASSDDFDKMLSDGNMLNSVRNSKCVFSTKNTINLFIL